MGKSIFQLYHKLPEIQGRVIQLSSWVISGQTAGINFREGKAGTNFMDANPFLPHYVMPAKLGEVRKLKFKESYEAYQLRKALYKGKDIIPSIYNQGNLLVQRIATLKGKTFFTPTTQYKNFPKTSSYKQWTSYKAASDNKINPKKDTLGDLTS